MKLGVFTALFAGLTLDQVIEKVTAAGLDAVEIGTGAYPGAAHIDVEDLLSSKAKAKAYKTKLADAGLTISALSCHGNPLHPDKALAKNHDEVFRKTVRVAELLRRGRGEHVLRVPWRQRRQQGAQLDHLRVAARLPQGARLAVGEEGHPVLDARPASSPRITASAWPSSRTRGSWSTTSRPR